MLLHSCAVIALLSSVCSYAQTPAPRRAAAKEDSAMPAMNVRYTGKPGPYRGCQDRLAAIKGKPCDILFIGDSITDRWSGPGKEIWAASYAPRNALNFGVFADTTQNVLWRMDHMDVKSLRPKVAVILIGTNNTKDTPQGIASGVKAVINKTQSLFAGVKVILVSIMPNQRAEALMMSANDIIKGYADNRTVYWLDLIPLMPPVTNMTPNGAPDPNWKGLGSDHLHPDASGYQIWHDAMEPLLGKLVTSNSK